MVEKTRVSLTIVEVETIPKLFSRSSKEVVGGNLFVDSDISWLKSWPLSNNPPNPVSFLNSGCWQPTKLHIAIAINAKCMSLRIESWIRCMGNGC